MPQDARRTYRTSPRANGGLEISVQGPDGGFIPANTLDASVNGAGLRLSHELLPPLSIGQVVTLRMAASLLPAPLEAKAKVIDRLEEGGFSRYGLRFLDPRALAQCLSPELMRVFNKRHAFRVQPDPEDPVRVTLRSREPVEAVPMDEDVEIVLVNGDLVVSGRLRDISASGAGVLVTETAESSFASVNLAQVSFVLPPGTTPLVLDTRIRHRAAARDFVRYGLEFIEGDNDEILAFVMRRQRESLRTKSR